MDRARRDALRSGGLLLALAFAAGCASTPPPASPPERTLPRSARTETAALRHAPEPELRARIVESAEAMIGAPYRYGGSTPAGFDCSGLVRFSYGRAGVQGLPRTASDLEARADTIALSELRPADLLFFRLDGTKTRHVGIYAGDGQFIHAPSPGKRVERIPFDHVYWGRRLSAAGRLLRDAPDAP